MDSRITKIRKDIDRLDDELLGLLIKRLKLGKEIGEVKREIGRVVADEAREKQIFQRLIKNAGSKMAEKDIIEIFSKILEISRKTQK
ncbi:MAG: chorismate mutase [Candidatus Marinimicrobia bacterium]|jgi:chorismate mutase|nr:chorismate mutase [Candidatus Neomarinimicrobiota bacterium]